MAAKKTEPEQTEEKVAQPEWMTREKPNLATRLRRIMAEPQMAYLQRQATAGSDSDSWTYKYIPHGQVSATIQPLLWQHGVLMLTKIGKVEYVQHNRTLHVRLNITIVFVNTDNSQEREKIPWRSNSIPTSPDKGLDSAISSGVRQATMKAFQIASGEMDLEAFHVMLETTPQVVRTVPEKTANGTAEHADYLTLIKALMEKYGTPEGGEKALLIDLAETLTSEGREVAIPRGKDAEWDRGSLREIHDRLDDMVRRGFRHPA